MLLFLTGALVIGADQLCKKFADENIEEGQYVQVVKDKFYVANVKNKGAAYGFLGKKRKTLMAATFAALALVGAMFVSAQKNNYPKFYKFSLILILSGGLSNMFDRIFKKQVTDYLYIKYKKAPVFNIADVGVFLGALFCFLSELRKK